MPRSGVPTAFQDIARRSRRQAGLPDEYGGERPNFQPSDGSAPVFVPPPSTEPTRDRTPANSNFSSIDGGATYVPPPEENNFNNSQRGAVQVTQNIPDPVQMISDSQHYQAVRAIEEPGGWKNVGDVLLIAANPFSQQRIQSTLPGFAGDVSEAVANNPYTTALLATGVVGAIRSISAGIASLGRTSTQTYTGVVRSKVGSSVAQSIPTNSATQKATASMLSKFVSSSRNTKYVVGGLMAAIGTYPFAGFIKEEALQTLSFGVSSAVRNGDAESAQAAIDLQSEMLDPGVWSQIKGTVPFVNVLDKLNDFYKAARVKLMVDQKVVDDLRTGQTNGESPQQLWTRVDGEIAAQDTALTDNYAQRRMLLVQWENEAKLANQQKIADLWAQQRRDLIELERKEREDTALFWQEYRKRMQELTENNKPSNLNFGLL